MARGGWPACEGIWGRGTTIPAAVESLGERALNLTTEVWWSPNHPFCSGITGQTAAEFCVEYENQTGKQWPQPMGFKHALSGVTIDVRKRALEGSEQGLSLGQLAKQLDLPKSTVQRIVAALDRENFVIAATPQVGVRLGPALARIARSIRFRLAEITRPYLERPAQRTGETVDLAVLDGAKVVFLDHIEGKQRLRAVSAMGVSFPLHCCANGKAMMAALDDAFRRLTKNVRLTKLTPHSIRKWSDLEAEIKKIRATGIAFDLEEHTLGISVVGTASLGPEGEIAAISIPTPSVRFLEKKHELEAALRDCPDELSEALGSPQLSATASVV